MAIIFICLCVFLFVFVFSFCLLSNMISNKLWTASNPICQFDDDNHLYLFVCLCYYFYLFFVCFYLYLYFLFVCILIWSQPSFLLTISYLSIWWWDFSHYYGHSNRNDDDKNIIDDQSTISTFYSCNRRLSPLRPIDNTKKDLPKKKHASLNTQKCWKMFWATIHEIWPVRPSE